MTGIERLRALADEMARGGWRGLGEELRSIAEQIEREQETDGAAHGRRTERTCRMGAPIDGEYRCGECSHLNRETYRADKGWCPPEYCAHCGARVVDE